jgi:hypothetical protein
MYCLHILQFINYMKVHTNSAMSWFNQPTQAVSLSLRGCPVLAMPAALLSALSADTELLCSAVLPSAHRCAAAQRCLQPWTRAHGAR